MIVQDKIKSTLKEEQLQYKYLPGFADFLLHQKLDEFVAELLSITRRVNFPLLKYFAHLSDEDLINMSKVSNTEFLTHTISNTLYDHLTVSIQKWKDNQLPLVKKDQLVAEDVLLAGYIRKKAYMKFLPQYTTDLHLMLSVLGEIDHYYIKVQELSLNTFIGIQNEELHKANAKLAEKNIELEQSNKELTSFSYVASHDLKEPLRKIKTFVNLIIESGDTTISDQSRKSLDKINASATHMQNLIDNLLAFASTHTKGVFEDIDLNDLLTSISESHETIQHDTNILISHEPLPKIKGIAFQFRQLFENLISNSIKYRTPGVDVVIKTTYSLISGAKLVSEGGYAYKQYHQISFSDNGIGFDQSYAYRVFEIFQRLHSQDTYSGTGIGLAICKKIVQNHNGLIFARSSPGQGTTIHICLPTH